MEAAVLTYSQIYRANNLESCRQKDRERYALLAWRHLLKDARKRATASSLDYDLTSDWAASTWTGKCQLSGIEFRRNKDIRGSFSPSIDRIIPELGYIQSNCRFILWGLNALKCRESDADLYFIAEQLLAQRIR